MITRIINTKHLQYRGDVADPAGGDVFLKIGKGPKPLLKKLGHVQNMPMFMPIMFMCEWSDIFDRCMADAAGWDKLARAIERERRKKRRKP